MTTNQKKTRTNRYQRDLDVMHAIGKCFDQWPADEWPPLFPTQAEIAEMGGFDPEIARRKIRKFANRTDRPLIVTHGQRYSLTIYGIQWLYDNGYLRRYIKAASGQWGMRVRKLELLYPTA